jgi:hydrogenase maturation protease
MNAIRTLVIACGNPLRGDDGVGRAAADIVQSWRTPGVKVLSVHQLVPELISEMKQVERVLFIDAGTNADARPFLTCILEPKKSRRFFGHHETPANLLALVGELGGRAPKAWLVSISAVSFDHGEAITQGARNNMTAALGCIRAYLDEPSGAPLTQIC